MGGCSRAVPGAASRWGGTSTAAAGLTWGPGVRRRHLRSVGAVRRHSGRRADHVPRPPRPPDLPGLPDLQDRTRLDDLVGDLADDSQVNGGGRCGQGTRRDRSPRALRRRSRPSDRPRPIGTVGVAADGEGLDVGVCVLVLPDLQLVSGLQADAADWDRSVIEDIEGGFGMVLFTEPAVGSAVVLAGRRSGRVDVAHA